MKIQSSNTVKIMNLIHSNSSDATTPKHDKKSDNFQKIIDRIKKTDSKPHNHDSLESNMSDRHDYNDCQSGICNDYLDEEYARDDLLTDVAIFPVYVSNREQVCLLSTNTPYQCHDIDSIDQLYTQILNTHLNDNILSNETWKFSYMETSILRYVITIQKLDKNTINIQFNSNGVISVQTQHSIQQLRTKLLSKISKVQIEYLVEDNIVSEIIK
ncbi:MAG: hypothetical protein ABW101_02180 [Candidatus Thiodiazotropha sp.]